jgi:ABC-type amino acid transport system permease subunit
MHTALALGMSWRQAVGRIILPQAAIRMMPPLNTRIVRNIKDSVLASTIAVQELFWAANLLEGETAKPFPIYTTLMVFYFIMIVTIARVLDRVYVAVAARGAA